MINRSYSSSTKQQHNTRHFMQTINPDMFLRENSSSTSQQPNTPYFIHTVKPDMFLRENSSSSTNHRPNTRNFMNRAHSITRLNSIFHNPSQFKQKLPKDSITLIDDL